MAGTLDWHDEQIKCPNCKNTTAVSICVDTDPHRGDTSGIAGGSANCNHCGATITDDDLNEKDQSLIDAIAAEMEEVSRLMAIEERRHQEVTFDLLTRYNQLLRRVSELGKKE